MTKDELFAKYGIKNTHDAWTSNDNWYSVEIYRIMHNGNLPANNDMDILYVLKFLDKVKDFDADIVGRRDFDSLYITAKRSVFRYADYILEQVNKP